MAGHEGDNREKLQPVLTWCHERAAEARQVLRSWNEHFAADPGPTLRKNAMSMFLAVAEIEVYEGLIRVLSRPNTPVTLADLEAQGIEGALRYLRDYARPYLRQHREEPTTEIYLHLVAAVYADLQPVIVAAAAAAKAMEER